jgi:hypothetical protein
MSPLRHDARMQATPGLVADERPFHEELFKLGKIRRKAAERPFKQA